METRKTRGGAYIRRGLLPDVFFCLLVDGPITGGAYKLQFTVDTLPDFFDYVLLVPSFKKITQLGLLFSAGAEL